MTAVKIEQAMYAPTSMNRTTTRKDPLVRTETYTCDLGGNRIKTGGTFVRSNVPPALATTNYNTNDQQLTFGTSTEAYDLNGNLATSTDAGGTTTYTWNARNQLTGISKTGLTASFTYDRFDRRTAKTIQGTMT